MWDIKLKLIDTDDNMVATRGKGVGVVKHKRGVKLYGDRRRLDFGW